MVFLVLALALVLCAALVVYAVVRLTRRHLPPRAKVRSYGGTRHPRDGAVRLELVTDRGPITLDVSPRLAAAMARELTGADPRRTH